MVFIHYVPVYSHMILLIDNRQNNNRKTVSCQEIKLCERDQMKMPIQQCSENLTFHSKENKHCEGD